MEKCHMKKAVLLSYWEMTTIQIFKDYQNEGRSQSKTNKILATWQRILWLPAVHCESKDKRLSKLFPCTVYSPSKTAVRTLLPLTGFAYMGLPSLGKIWNPTEALLPCSMFYRVFSIGCQMPNKCWADTKLIHKSVHIYIACVDLLMNHQVLSEISLTQDIYKVVTWSNMQLKTLALDVQRLLATWVLWHQQQIGAEYRLHPLSIYR